MPSQIKSVRKRARKAPLDDIRTLQLIAGQATRRAIKVAHDAGVAITFIENGRILQQHPDHSVTEVKKIDKPELTLDDLLCQA